MLRKEGRKTWCQGTQEEEEGSSKGQTDRHTDRQTGRQEIWGARVQASVVCVVEVLSVSPSLPRTTCKRFFSFHRAAGEAASSSFATLDGFEDALNDSQRCFMESHIVNGNAFSDYRYFKYFLNAFRDKLHLSIQEEASTMGDLTTVTTF